MNFIRINKSTSKILYEKIPLYSCFILVFILQFAGSTKNYQRGKIELQEFFGVKGNVKEIDAELEASKVVGKTSADDCRHIATATINKVDILVSWNFKHIVKVFRIRGYNSINLSCGYSQLDIRSPREIVYHENDN